ncbi:MAG: GNAT family N-acetyltransferase [Candidatus Heimdallarchaeota archaeon]|nr:GNAT family N-acetyltransferase [Candidatus Heimdallarchaeota archaeon]MBY8993895.1 GNAT family N-acetyltransferase [Candidatus Heimdallarchaeota archaeon]
MSEKEKIDLTEIIIEHFDQDNLAEDFWEKYHAFNEKTHKELFPNDSLPNRKVVEINLVTGWPDYHVIRDFVYKDSSKKKIIAHSIYAINREDAPGYENNKHNSFFYILIDSRFRRQGLGKLLFKSIIGKVKEKGCKFTETDTYYESGKEFCKKIGGKLINEHTENRLQMEEIDWKVINEWRNEGKEKAPMVVLENFIIVPEKDIVEICELETNLERQIPTLDDKEKWTDIYTPEKKRKIERNRQKQGYINYTIISREYNGTISGMTEIRYSRTDRPERINQGLTGVLEDFRGRDLGKWLKAEMLVYIENHIPDARFIVTSNSDHNASMNSINERLGFKPFYNESSYKFRLTTVIKRMNKMT